MTIPTKNQVTQASPLGKPTKYIAEYAPELLFPIPRLPKRTEIHIPTPLPFYGCDVWNAYELSWLNERGKPLVAIGKITIPCDSPNLIESKSIKLYLNSFNNSKFPSKARIVETIANDLSEIAGSEVRVTIQLLSETEDIRSESFSGTCIDPIDIDIQEYQVNPTLLTTENKSLTETLYSNLLKSNCLCTGQPDWGSLKIQYHGPKINHENLLRYIISYRNHVEFNEQCIERIFMDILNHCQPKELTIEGRYTRRGGLDINPIRSTQKSLTFSNQRQIRQ